MPSKGTPARTIRVPNPEWKAAGDTAADLGSDLSAELRATVHQLATRRIKEIRMPATATTTRCTWENPCATCAAANAKRGINNPSVVHNPWLMVGTKDLMVGDEVRDFGDGEHVSGTVSAVSDTGLCVNWTDGETTSHGRTSASRGAMLRLLRDGELTFWQEMAASR